MAFYAVFVGLLLAPAESLAATSTEPPFFSASFGPLKVKKYEMSGQFYSSRQDGRDATFTIDFERRNHRSIQSHIYSFKEFSSINSHSGRSVQMKAASDLRSGSLSASLGKYGKLKLHFLNSGRAKSVKPPRFCTGRTGTSRKGTLTGSFTLVADHTYFKTVKAHRFGGFFTRVPERKCKVHSVPGGPEAGSLSLNGDDGDLQVFFGKGASGGVSEQVLSSIHPDPGAYFQHTISTGLPRSSFTAAPDLSSAHVSGGGSFLAGKADFTASSHNVAFASGSLSGSMVAKFDSIGTKHIRGPAFLQRVGANQPPIADFAAQNQANPRSYQFTDQSYDPDGTVVSRSWNFGDGATSTQTNPSHTYTPGGGTFAVRLTVRDNKGATATKTETITVPADQPPTANFLYDCGSCSITDGTNTVTFTDMSSDPDGIVVAWSWTFGDGGTSTAQSPTHAYITAGDYQVMLKVTDNEGRQTTTMQTVHISP